MKAVRRLFAHYEEYHRHGPLMLRYFSVVGLLFFPAYYLLRLTRAEPVYDDLALRLFDAAICGLLLLRARWPRRLRPWYLPYSYLVLVITLPATFVFTSLKNGGGTVAVGNTLMATFLVILLADWRNMAVILLAGFGLATGAYVLFDAAPALPADYVARLPILLAVVLGGSLFKHALERSTAEKVRSAYAWLAGVHRPRDAQPAVAGAAQPGSACRRCCPRPVRSRRSRSWGRRSWKSCTATVAQGEQAIQRGLQVISMTLDEVNARPLDTASFSLPLGRRGGAQGGRRIRLRRRGRTRPDPGARAPTTSSSAATRRPSSSCCST